MKSESESGYDQEIKRLNNKIAELDLLVSALNDEVDEWKGKYHDLEVETDIVPTWCRRLNNERARL